MSSVDFHYIPPAQEAIHERLLNWARCMYGKDRAVCSPMFASYRSTEVWAAPEASSPVDKLDAERVEKAVRQLDPVEREAIRWHYVNTRRHSPARACRWLGLAKGALAQAVIDGRESLQLLLTGRVNPVSSAERMSQ